MHPIPLSDRVSILYLDRVFSAQRGLKVQIEAVMPLH